MEVAAHHHPDARSAGDLIVDVPTEILVARIHDHLDEGDELLDELERRYLVALIHAHGLAEQFGLEPVLGP